MIRLRATPVQVPAKPDSLNSPEIDDADAAFAAKYFTGARWTTFPMETKWILEYEDGSGAIGIGETYRGIEPEAMRAAMEAFRDSAIERLNWQALPVEDPRIYDAFESAVLDLAGQRAGLPVYQLLGGAYRDRVECSGWTGRRTPADAGRKAAEALARGHRVFKFKCADTDAVREWCEAVEATCGDGIRILLDPNQRWNDVETARRLMAGVNPKVMFGLEDPVRRADLAGFRTLREEFGIPLFLHIALPYRQEEGDLFRAVTAGAVDGINVNGSMFAFLRLARAAAIAGLPCWHGSEVDLGILEVSALHACAAAERATLPADLFGELVRENDLLIDGIRFERGEALVPQGPGLGVSLDREALGRYQSGETIHLE